MKTFRTQTAVSLLLIGLALPVLADTSCPVDASWLSNPTMPTEVKQSAGPGNSTFCDFYQFSTQTYLYLMSANSQGQRNFMDASQYALLEFDNQGNPANSCDNMVKGPTLRTSLNKADSTSISTQQAGDGATIYAQDGNVVYYDVRFSKSMCGLPGSAVQLQKQNLINFPGGTTEIKAAWKVLSAAEISAGTFVTQQQSIGGQPQTLGLVGMHIAVATPDHPEFVWATFEHKQNTPDCAPSSITGKDSFTFASLSCATGLTGTAAAGDTCNFNNPSEGLSAATGTPTNICRVYPFGTGSGDLKAVENISAIEAQNSGLGSLLGGTSVPAGMPVLGNYFNVGALWVSNTAQSSGGQGVPNERGSLRLANSVAETTFQHVNLNSTKFVSNCFGCHNYVGTGNQVNNNITSQNLSHIFLDIVVGKGQAIDVTSTTAIGSNSAAQAICQGSATNPGVCPNAANNLKWNGQWTNINSSAGSVCGCVAQ
ncbi:mannan-binding protein [Rheinheimera sp.]|uniref:mannan-binding protein n=1 Tax=Rheinheimera sp. TaxID=1869214 RepID=UPI003AF73D21